MDKKSWGPNITNDDRLYFGEVMLSDDVKSLYRVSQDRITRSELDSQKSILYVVYFYDKVTEVFNNKKSVSETELLPDLHEDFAETKNIIGSIRND